MNNIHNVLYFSQHVVLLFGTIELIERINYMNTDKYFVHTFNIVELFTCTLIYCP